VGLQEQPSSLRGLSGLYSALVGRQRELGALEQLMIERPIHPVEESQPELGQRGGAALVIGEAGLGKSRLVSEWRARTEARLASPYRWVEGRSLSYGQRQAYHLIVDILLAMLGVAHQADDAEKQNALRAAMSVTAEPPEMIYPYLAHLLGLGLGEQELALVQHLDPQALQNRYYQALRQFMLGLALTQPLVIVWEDFHWADASSVELLLRLRPALDEAPLLFCFISRPNLDSPAWKLVTAYREELRQAESSAGAEAQNIPSLVDVSLEPLSAAEVRQLTANLLNNPDLPESLYAAIMQKAEGNPFFVEEVIRMLIENGALVQRPASGEGARWQPAKPIEALEIPDNLQGLLLARIDQLSEGARQTLRVATVIGRRFMLPILEHVLAVGQAAGGWVGLQDSLGELENTGVIRRLQTDPAPEYIFQHTLVYEAAYNALLRQDRRSLHQAVGAALEALYPHKLGEMADTLAYHYTNTEQDEKAFHYLVMAGDGDFQRYAIPEALVHYGSALAIARRTPEVASAATLQHLYLRQGRALELGAHYEEALEIYAELEQVAERLNTPAMQLAALMEHAKMHAAPTPVFNQADGWALAEQALELAVQLGDRAAEARIYWIMMLISWMSAQHEQFLAYGEKSLAIARELNLREQLAYTLHDLHRAYGLAGRTPEAVAALDESRQLWRELGNLPMLADNLNSTADMLQTSGDYGKALELAEEAYQISQSIGNLWNQAYARCLVGEIYADQGLISPGLRALEEARVLSEQAGLIILATRIYSGLTWYRMQVGDAQGGHALVQEVMKRYVDARGLFGDDQRASLWAGVARAAIYVEDCSTAEADLQKAFALLNFMPGPETRSAPFRVSLAYAELLAAQGDYDRAEALIADLMRQAVFQLGAAEFPRIHAEYLIALGRLDEAEVELHRVQTKLRAVPKCFHWWKIYHALSQLAERQGRPDEAVAMLAKARAMIQTIVDKIEDEHLRASFLGVPRVRSVMR
jgi:predicted ATPase